MILGQWWVSSYCDLLFLPFLREMFQYVYIPQLVMYVKNRQASAAAGRSLEPEITSSLSSEKAEACTR